MRNNNKGFSLVELIVVIAIMAILAAVAVVGVSVYIPKAQQANDKQLVSDIEYGLNLYYQSNADNMTGGYIVLSKDAAPVVGGCGDEAMKLVYGENWATRNDLKLAYGKWSDDGLLQYVLENSANSQIVAGSSFVQNRTPAQLVDSFGTLTDSLSGMAATAGSDPLETMATYNILPEDQITSIRNELASLGLSWDSAENADNSEYSTALSNLLVKNVSSELGTADPDAQVSGVAGMAAMYATIYGWAATDKAGQTALDNLNAVITNPDSNTGDIVKAFGDIDTSEGSPLHSYMTSETAKKDEASLPVIMGAVSDITANYDITQEGLFSAESIGEQVDNYISAVVTVSGLDENQILELQSKAADGAVVIFLSENGQIIVMPAAIRSAD